MIITSYNHIVVVFVNSTLFSALDCMSLLATSHSGSMKGPRGNIPLPIITAIICAITFIVLLYSEQLNIHSSSSFFRIKSCSKGSILEKSNDEMENIEEGESIVDDRFDFDPEECNVANGKWVFNSSLKPLYTDTSCPYLDRQVSCVKNGRNDSDYRHWEWQPEDCTLPRFSPERALKKLRGKRVLFVGDSLQRGQWQSFVCLVESIIPDDQKSMKRGRSHSVFKAKEYNASIEFYWAPFLVESNTDLHIIADPKKRILKVDSVAKHAKNWVGMDVLVFNTYVWWMTGLRLKSLWGSFANGDEGYEELEAPVAYKIGLRTWANWVDSTVNPNNTKVFFTTMSPTHQRSKDWGNGEGIKCFNETRPVAKKGHWGSGSDKAMMKVVADVVGRMKVHVSVINVTQISEYRVDAHTSIYTETGGKLLTDDQRADPFHHADCIHWCLPGVPDTWNQILLAHL